VVLVEVVRGHRVQAPVGAAMDALSVFRPSRMNKAATGIQLPLRNRSGTQELPLAGSFQMALDQSHDKPRGMIAELDARNSFCKISMVVCNLQNKHQKKFL
jgi:hypothetical protein